MAVEFEWSTRERSMVLEATAKMFLVFGVRDASERVAAYVSLFQQECYCAPCVTFSIGKALITASRLPAPERILDLYQEAMGTEHAKHLVETGPELDAGRMEAFWRQQGRAVIEEFGCSRDVALSVAAQMWWSGSVLATEEAVREEMEGHGKMWVPASEAFLGEQGPAKVESLFTRARKMEAHGIESLTDDDIQMRDTGTGI